MTRYYFHLHDRSGVVLDEEGLELPGLDQVRSVALKAARSIVSSDVEAGRLDLGGHIEVADAEGRPVLLLQFKDAAGSLT